VRVRRRLRHGRLELRPELGQLVVAHRGAQLREDDAFLLLDVALDGLHALTQAVEDRRIGGVGAVHLLEAPARPRGAGS
jgi:hypothetical protein